MESLFSPQTIKRFWFGAILFSFLIPGTPILAQAYNSLAEAYAALGFDPAIPGNHVVVLASDVHMNLDINGVPAPVATTNLDYRMVRVINAMSPPPARLLISGDVSSSMAAIPGGDASNDPPTLRNATNEMIFFLESLRALTNIAPENILWIPGNHDQGAFESDAQTFRRMFPNMPAYQKFEFAGIHWFLMNPGNFGAPDEPQRLWALAEAAKLNPTDDVVVMTHQPPFANPVAHRGMGLLLRDMFGKRQSRWWLVDGHEHARALRTWQIGESRVAEITLGPATTNTFVGFTHDVGIAFLCLSNGVVGQIYYHYGTETFNVWPQPDWDWPLTYTPAFEKVHGLLWRRLKTGFGKAPEQTRATATDSIHWWAYPKELEWEMPLGEFGNQAADFLLAMAGVTPTVTIDCSADRVDWHPLEVPSPANSIYHFPIPNELKASPKAYLRLRANDFGNNWVGGWGLATTHTNVTFKYPQLHPVPDYYAFPGRSIAILMRVTNPFSPPDPTRFVQLAGPTGSTTDRYTGVFQWSPPASTPPGEYEVRIQVTDEGTPPAMSEQSFKIRLLPGGGPLLTVPRAAPNAPLEFDAVGDGGSLHVLYSDDQETWHELLQTNAPTLRIPVADPDFGSGRQRFYKVQQTNNKGSAAGPTPWPAHPPYLLQLQTPPAQFNVLVSSNLVDWTLLRSTNVPGTRITVEDTGAQRWQPRIYRLEAVGQ